MEKYQVSERRACRALNFNRSGIRYEAKKLPDEDALTEAIIKKACEYGRYGYRRITALLWHDGWKVNHKRVERIWREQGLRVPQKQSKKKRLFDNDGNVVRFRAEHANHVWSYDFIEDRLTNGKKVRWLNIIDEYTRECLASVPARSWKSNNVIEVLSSIMIMRGAPEYIRSDNGPEFVARKLKVWLRDVSVQTLYIEPGSPWENGYVKSFNSKMCDEFLNVTLFDTFNETVALTKIWIREYNTVRPHSACGYKPPAYQSIAA